MPCSRKSYHPKRAAPYPTRNQRRIEATRAELCAAQNAHGVHIDISSKGLPEPTFHQDGIHCLRDKATHDEYQAWCAKLRNTYGSYAKYNERRWSGFCQAVYADWKEDQQFVKDRDATDAEKAAELAKVDAVYRATQEDHPWLGTSVEDDPVATYGSERD